MCKDILDVLIFKFCNLAEKRIDSLFIVIFIKNSLFASKTIQHNTSKRRVDPISKSLSIYPIKCPGLVSLNQLV